MQASQDLDYVEAADTDEDFAELDELLNPKPTPDADDPDEAEEEIDELEALLGEALADKKVADHVKAARAKAKSGFGLSAEDLERIRKWELAKEWLPVANTALFKRYVCTCGFHTTVFEGLMLEQRHRHSSHANRWTVQEAALASLPNKTAIRTARIPMCQRCAASKGYSLVTDLEWQV
jgi:hypothetical protein